MLHNDFITEPEYHDAGTHAGYTLKLSRLPNKYTGKYGCLVIANSGTSTAELLTTQHGDTPGEAIAAARAWIGAQA